MSKVQRKRYGKTLERDREDFRMALAKMDEMGVFCKMVRNTGMHHDNGPFWMCELRVINTTPCIDVMASSKTAIGAMRSAIYELSTIWPVSWSELTGRRLERDTAKCAGSKKPSRL